jgi:mRNA interferase RelE/StbE
VRLAQTAEFKTAYQRLTKREKKRVQVTLRLFVDNPRHPSLQAKKWDSDQWYYRVTPSIRVFYRMLADEWCELITVGHHDIEKRR